MSKDKTKKLNLIIYGIEILLSLFILYQFVFISNSSSGRRITLIIIGIFWLIFSVFGFVKTLKNK